MSLDELIDDLRILEELAAHEDDPDRRKSLDVVRDHLIARDRGAKVSEAAQVLRLPQPTIRAWIDSGILELVAGVTPVRINVLSLAHLKRTLDLIRPHADNRRLLADVSRTLRDRAALAGCEDGLADLAAGRVAPLGDDLLREIDQIQRRDRARSKPS